MRLTYYEFPNNISVKERVKIYKELEGKTNIEIPEDISDEVLDDNFPSCMNCSVSFAKKMLKKYGGHAYTQHIDRDGCVFEVTPVKLGKNNSNHKYNVHL